MKDFDKHLKKWSKKVDFSGIHCKFLREDQLIKNQISGVFQTYNFSGLKMKSKVLRLKLENQGENEKVVKIFNKVDVRS